jgi:hypothetical protein
MGLPASWTILTITHYLICSAVDRQQRWFIKGDDLAALWGRKEIKRYKKLCAAVGLLVNTKKSFVAPNRLTFCEGMFELRLDRSPPGFYLLPSLSLKGFTTLETGTRYTDMATIMNEGVRRGVHVNKVTRIAHAAWPKDYACARKMRVHKYVPPVFGGLGFPHENPNSLVPTRIASLCLGSLEKGTSAPSTLIFSAPSPQLKVVARLLKKVLYKTGVSETQACLHFDGFCTFLRQRASVFDAGAKASTKKIGSKAYLGRLKRIERKLSRREGDHKLTWRGLQQLTKLLRPTPTSIQSVYPHQCVGGEETGSNV